MSSFYIYVLFRPWNGEPCYVGKGTGRRLRQHDLASTKHYNRHLANIYAKAGGGPLPCVTVHDDLDETTAFEYEAALIAAIGRSDLGLGPLVNLTDGGGGHSGYRQSDELKQRRREEWTPDRRAAFGEYSRNAIHGDPEVRAKYERNQRAAFECPEIRKKCGNARRGKTNSEELNAAIQRGQLARWADPANHEKQRQIQLARYEDPAERARTGEAVTLAFSTPEARAGLSERSIEASNRPEEIERRRAAMVARYADPAEHERQSARMKEWWTKRRAETG